MYQKNHKSTTHDVGVQQLSCGEVTARELSSASEPSISRNFLHQTEAGGGKHLSVDPPPLPLPKLEHGGWQIYINS